MLDGSDVSMASEICGLCREMTDTTSTSMIDRLAISSWQEINFGFNS